MPTISPIMTTLTCIDSRFPHLPFKDSDDKRKQILKRGKETKQALVYQSLLNAMSLLIYCVFYQFSGNWPKIVL